MLVAGATDKAHLIIEIAIHPEDIGMSQVGLNLNLPAQLVLHARILQLSFEEYLQENTTLLCRVTANPEALTALYWCNPPRTYVRQGN